MLGYNVSVPPFVRQAMFSRVLDNDDLMRTIHTPTLITHGAADRAVKMNAVEQHRALIPHAQVHIMPNAGHAPFFDDAASFNERLSAFCEQVAPARITGDRAHAPIR
jgi:pimeloyl-ACP methyl ester carboxylesterase